MRKAINLIGMGGCTFAGLSEIGLEGLAASMFSLALMNMIALLSPEGN